MEHAKDKKVILKFWANWCGPCMKFKPVMEKVEQETGVLLLNIDVDKASSLAQKYGIRGIPTTIFLDNLEVKATFVGDQPATYIKEKLRLEGFLTESPEIARKERARSLSLKVIALVHKEEPEDLKIVQFALTMAQDSLAEEAINMDREDYKSN